MLSTLAIKALLCDITSSGTGPANEVIDSLNQAQWLAANSGWTVPAAIVATTADATTDFSALKVDDLVVHIPATAGSAQFAKTTVAGTNPIGAAVIGDLYVVLRAWASPAANTVVL